MTKPTTAKNPTDRVNERSGYLPQRTPASDNPGWREVHRQESNPDIRRIKMKQVIIIGAGMGGLYAGNLLAKKGHKVTIFEAHSAPGGYTAGFYRKGYYFESGTVNLEASASVFKAMKDIGVFDKIGFVKLRTRFLSDNFDGIPANYDDFKRMVYTGFPSDRERLDRAFSDLDEITGALGDMDTPMPFICKGFSKAKTILPYIPRMPKLLKAGKRFGEMPSSEFASRYFEEGSELYRIFMGTSYPDMPALALGGNFLSVFNDLWTVKGGMQAWADTLAENFMKLGGQLKLKSRVDSILTKNRAAAGVSCNHTVYEADYVIAAMDYKGTLLKLLDDQDLIPQTLQDAISNAAISEGYCTVYLGLDMTNEELGGYMKAPHIFSCDKKQGYDIYDPNDEKYFQKTSVSIYSPSMVNEKLAPEGKSSLMIQTMVPYRWMNNWGGGDKEAYRRLKEDAMETMIDSACRVIPGLRESIQYKEAATPLTYERFTGNTGGATSAWSWNPRKRFFKSSMSIHTGTPVKNLYIGSCWAMQIGGVPGALGAACQCANKIR